MIRGARVYHDNLKHSYFEPEGLVLSAQAEDAFGLG